MSESILIGAIIIDSQNIESIIVDKVLGYCNSSNPTVFICMQTSGSVHEVSYDEIKRIKSFGNTIENYLRPIEQVIPSIIEGIKSIIDKKPN